MIQSSLLWFWTSCRKWIYILGLLPRTFEFFCLFSSCFKLNNIMDLSQPLIRYFKSSWFDTKILRASYPCSTSFKLRLSLIAFELLADFFNKRSVSLIYLQRWLQYSSLRTGRWDWIETHVPPFPGHKLATPSPCGAAFVPRRRTGKRKVRWGRPSIAVKIDGSF